MILTKKKKYKFGKLKKKKIIKMNEEESYFNMVNNQIDLNESFDQISSFNGYRQSFVYLNESFDQMSSFNGYKQILHEFNPSPFEDNSLLISDPINESENILEESSKQEKPSNNSEENLSKRKTFASNGSSKNNSENNIQLSENKTPKILDNNPISEKSQNLDELNQTNNREKSLEDYKFKSVETILEKYAVKLEKVKNILTINGKNIKTIEKKLSNNEKIEKKKLIGNKRTNDAIEEKIEKKENTKGRKKEGDNSGEHTKMKEDNLMFKIRSNFNKWLLNLVNKYLPDSQKLMKIDFKKFSKVINTNENLKFLKMKLSEIFSINISKVYSKKIMEEDGINFNKNIIEDIMKSDNEKAKALLKLTYKDGLNLFRFQENENIKKILGDEIINDIKGRVDEFLFNTFQKEIEKIGEEEANDFVSSLFVMVYNYERWFLLKFPRKKRENTNKTEIKDRNKK